MSAPETASRSTGRRGRRLRLAVVLAAVIAAMTLWLWPLLYVFLKDECGADIGLGLFGFPGAFCGVVACLFLGAAYRQDKAIVVLCVVGGAAGSLSLLGATGAPPYAQWLQYAVDHWYGPCN